MKDAVLKRPRVFHGYWILGACFIFSIISTGCGMSSFSFFVTSLESDLGWSRTEIMTALMVLQLLCAAASPFVGQMVNRHGARKIYVPGALLAVGGFILLSQMDSLWQYYLGYVIIGIGLTAIGQVTSSFVVSKWFVKRRGTAIGIMSMGIGITGFVFSFLVIVYLIPNFGWSNTYLAYAAMTGGLVIPLSLFIIRTEPSEMGLFPDNMDAGEAAIVMGTRDTAAEGMPLKAALTTPAFWLLAASLVLFHNHSGVMQSQVPRMLELGFSNSITASAFSVLSIGATFSMFFFGWLCDRMPAKVAGAIGMGFVVVAILIFINVDTGSPVWLIWLYALIFGFGAGSWLPTLSMLTINAFGPAYYGAIFGMMSFFQNFGVGTGPLLTGYIYDTTHSYDLAFTIFLIMSLLAIPLFLAVRRPSSYPAPK
jgi:MFS family permease